MVRVLDEQVVDTEHWAGTKTVSVQYRDRAGNISAAVSDAIMFNP